VNIPSLLESMRNANKPLLLLAFGIYSLNYVFCLVRWEMLLKAVKVTLRLSRVLSSFAGGIFFNLFLPSTIGGDLMRTMDLAAYTKKPKEIIATVLLDRLSGYVGMVIVVCGALIFGWRFIEDRSVLAALIALCATLIFFLMVLYNNYLYSKINNLLKSPNAGRIRELITNLHEEIYYFRNHRKVIVMNIIISILIQVITPLVYYVVALALGFKVSILYFFIFLPIITAIALLPISLGGLGLRDATTIYFFAKIGMAKDLAFAMSLLNFFFIFFFGAVGGLIYVFTVHHRRIQPHQASSVCPPRP